ncbi:uncharacterized protein LOC126653806 [Mercurialis annua]|uniref:uncharacterized protein LOC126653806 n=1 Tax=Mercurialis annua TaxID=3986 RepID=UPI00215ED228|nr:uncharacterized protein LOC126653806 [Mercurialis annua]
MKLRPTKHKDSPSSSKEIGRNCRSKKMIKIEDLLEMHPPTLNLKIEPTELDADAEAMTEQPTPENDMHSDPLSALSGPPYLSGVTTDLLQCNLPAISEVKNALTAFLLTKSNHEDVDQMIKQANNAFLYLKGVNADYRTFYATVRSYILNCSKLCQAEKEVSENSHIIKVIVDHEKLNHQSSKVTEAVYEIEDNLVKAKESMAPLEARVQDAKKLLEKFELEVGEKKTDIETLEADKARFLEKRAAMNVQLQHGVVKAATARSTLSDILSHREAARAAMEESRAQLTTM